ncbi:MAG: peptide deformylase [Lachnospiraceae bacterium]|nr:peptide deformylase [Lachnospiraceae bacterium]
MALRNIRIYGDDILSSRCKEVKEMTPRISSLIDDMFETMYDADGVGLAAPQVGILKRIAVIDVTGEDPMVLINPVITETDGEQEGTEGCLSLPGKVAMVKRPNHVKVKALNRDMEPVEYEGTELLARAMVHEIDHLDGHMYTEFMEGDLMDVQDLIDQNEENGEGSE